jgi:acetyl esterase/lipase
MDQQALDDAYDQDVYAPNRPLIVTRRIAASERTRAILGPPLRLSYGPSQYEQLDIFRTSTPFYPASAAGRLRGAPVNVFVHGGAWRRNKAADYALQAEPLVRAGAHAVIIDFINVEQAGGDLMPMYEQVRRALAWCGATRAASAAIRSSFTFRRIRRARTLPPACSPTAGAKRGCRRIFARARFSSAACTTLSRCGCPSAHPT